MKEYIYYWYHHMMPDNERKKIQTALDSKDYFAFLELYQKYGIKSFQYGKYYEEFKAWIPMTYLPSQIWVVENNDYDNSTYISVLDKENFDKITFHECECG